MKDEIVRPTLYRYLFRKASISKIPFSGAFEISPLCNMDCKMCYIKMTKDEMNKIGRQRTVDEWIEIAKQAKSMGMLFILITGGEPFLQKDFKELYIKLYNMGFVLSINTNATLISEKDIEWLSKYKPMRVNVTLYGSSNETYKKLCNNEKGFDQATRGIKLLQEASIPVKINASMTPDNEADLEGIFNFGKKNNLYVQATSYMYPPIRKDESSIGKNKRFTAKEAAINSVRIKRLRMDDNEFISYTENFKNGIFNHNETIDECMDIEGENMKCRAGISTFWISWDGKMMPCGMMNKPAYYPFEIGFEEAWKKIVDVSSKIRLPIECSTCKNRAVCKSCAATSIAEEGNSNKKPLYMCNMTSEIIKETQRVYNEIICQNNII
ncbi:radical SAM/SPASM domain-containing protein [Terrisporobacter sp.]